MNVINLSLFLPLIPKMYQIQTDADSSIAHTVASVTSEVQQQHYL